MKKNENYKCLFLANPWLPSEKIWFKEWVSVEKLTEYIKNSYLSIDSMSMNCNKDTIIIPGVFEYIQKEIETINWSKVENNEILFQKQEVIPVILKWFGWVIYYIANMNQDALNNTLNEWNLWVYSKTNQKLQKKWATSWDYIKITRDSFLYWNTQDWNIIGQLNCFPVNSSVCHMKDPKTEAWYPTCFFRWIDEIIGEIKTKISIISTI